MMTVSPCHESSVPQDSVPKQSAGYGSIRIQYWIGWIRIQPRHPGERLSARVPTPRPGRRSTRNDDAAPKCWQDRPSTPWRLGPAATGPHVKDRPSSRPSSSTSRPQRRCPSPAGGWGGGGGRGAAVHGREAATGAVKMDRRKAASPPRQPRRVSAWGLRWRAAGGPVPAGAGDGCQAAASSLGDAFQGSLGDPCKAERTRPSGTASRGGTQAGGWWSTPQAFGAGCCRRGAHDEATSQGYPNDEATREGFGCTPRQRLPSVTMADAVAPG